MIGNRTSWGTQVLAMTAVATLLVAAACGDDGDEDSALSPFCQDFQEFEDKWGGLDPEAFFSGELGEQGDQVISDLRSLDPPEAIAADWPKFVDTIEALIGDPEAAVANPELNENQQSFETVQNYVNGECVESE